MSFKKFIPIVLTCIFISGCARNIEFLNLETKVIQRDKIKLHSKFVAIEFFQTLCVPCRESVPHLNELQERKGLKIIAVSNEHQNVIKMFIKKYKPKYEIRQVPTKLFVDMGLGTKYVPHVFIYRISDGELLWEGKPEKITDKLLDKLKQKN
jgi:thiol-disulfide isomerase/thioredoxin